MERHGDALVGTPEDGREAVSRGEEVGVSGPLEQDAVGIRAAPEIRQALEGQVTGHGDQRVEGGLGNQRALDAELCHHLSDRRGDTRVLLLHLLDGIAGVVPVPAGAVDDDGKGTTKQVASVNGRVHDSPQLRTKGTRVEGYQKNADLSIISVFTQQAFWRVHRSFQLLERSGCSLASVHIIYQFLFVPHQNRRHSTQAILDFFV